MISVRLPPDIEEKIRVRSLAQHKPQSDVIREALDLLFKTEESEKDSYEIGKELFGRFGSGGSDQPYKARVKDKIRAKHHSH